MSATATSLGRGEIRPQEHRRTTAEWDVGARVSAVLRAQLEAGASIRSLAEKLGINAETLRRMYLSQRPSAFLLIRVCEKFEICGDWLLSGRGPQTREEVISDCLDKATPPELCRAAAARWQELQERLDQITVLAARIEAASAHPHPRPHPIPIPIPPPIPFTTSKPHQSPGYRPSMVGIGSSDRCHPP